MNQPQLCARVTHVVLCKQVAYSNFVSKHQSTISVLVRHQLITCCSGQVTGCHLSKPLKMRG